MRKIIACIGFGSLLLLVSFKSVPAFCIQKRDCLMSVLDKRISSCKETISNMADSDNPNTDDYRQTLAGMKSEKGTVNAALDEWLQSRCVIDNQAADSLTGVMLDQIIKLNTETGY